MTTAAMTPAVGMSLPLPAAAGATRPLVIGIDPSLTSLGIAGTDWADALRARHTGHRRLSWLRAEVYDRTRAADLVVIEGPAYRQQHQPGHHEAAGLWWLIVHDLWRRRIPYAVCPPQQRAMYVTGRGNAPKGEVRDGVRRLFGVECDGPGRYDKADAVAMAALGAHWLGYPIAAVPDTHARALAGVRWPEQTPAVAR